MGWGKFKPGNKIIVINNNICLSQVVGKVSIGGGKMPNPVSINA